MMQKNKLYFLLILVIIPLDVFSTNDYCIHNKVKVSDKYTWSQKMINEKINQLSNSTLIASQADNLLSKLIQAKSPVVINWISERGFDPEKDAEKIAVQWRQYFFKNFLLRTLPAENDKINQLVEKAFQEINETFLDKKYKSHLEKILEETKKLAIQRISSYEIESKNKSIIIKKIETIQIYWFQKIIGTKFEKKPLEFINWGIAYDPIPNEINIGMETLKYDSDSSLVAVLAHEIAHSFDPCRWTAFIGTKNPFKTVVSCLRSSKSVGAKKRDDSKIDLFVKMNRLTSEAAQSLKSNVYCNNSIYPPVGLQKEQILETFADWFSAEVVSENSKYIDKTLRLDLCKNEELTPGSSYISNNDRLQKIYFANPKIAKKLNTKKHHYCSINSNL